ncbi:MAG: dihydroorotase [Saprospiraceae bacterium]
MSSSLLIKNVRIVNEGSIVDSDLLIKNNRIEKISKDISFKEADIIEGNGMYLLPGCIDDQVHFREPGLTHKADIHTESAAAVAGGITSFMEMPNTIPNALTRALLEDKYTIASKKSFANYSFYMGTSNSNAEEVLRIDNKNVCGVKIFMGSSTGNMLVNNPNSLEKIFSESESLIAVHCEDEEIILKNSELFKEKYGDKLSTKHHPLIRSREACLKSSSYAVNLAKKYNTRLHILHISTAEELELFEPNRPIKDKRITAEACVHHMFFTSDDYELKGNLIKCNPAIKDEADRTALWNAIVDGRIDVIATDHAPHTIEEKNQIYIQAPSGLPLVQHALRMVLSIAEQTHWSLPFIAKKMAHDVADCFKIIDRGYIREGYFADLVLIDPNTSSQIVESELYYKCGWSPLIGNQLKGKVLATFVNGIQVYNGNDKPNIIAGQRMKFSN